MILVCEVQSLGQATTAAVDIFLSDIERLRKRNVGAKVAGIRLSLSTFEIGNTFGVSKYVGIEKGVVCERCVLVVLGALGVEFEGSLEAFQCFVDLDLAGVINFLVNTLLGFEVDGGKGRLHFYD